MANAQGSWLGSYRHGLALRRSLRMVLGSLVSLQPASYRNRLIPCSAWIVVAEVWPLSARPYGIALGASSNWMNNFIVGQVTVDMIEGIRYGMLTTTK